MLTRLGYYADKVIEVGWLAAAIMAPLFFNVYSSRVFEPDKISTIRSIVLIMLVAWLIKLLEGGRRAAAESTATTSSGRASAVAGAVVESAAPSWLGFLRVPMVVAFLAYALTYIISTIFSVTPDASIFGSYQRLQGLYSQMSYMMLGVLVLANMRSRAQLNRLVNFMIMTSIPVAVYGLVQAVRVDPLPWAGDTSTRVASTMGNAIFVAAWLIMVVPFTLYRFFNGMSEPLTRFFAWLRRRSGGGDTTEDEPEIVEVPSTAKARASRRVRDAELPSYGWAVVANAAGLIISSLMLFYIALKMMAGLPYPDARTWWVFPFATICFFLTCLGIEWLGKRADDPIQRTVILPSVGALVFFTSILALPLTWDLEPQTLVLRMGLEGAGFLWAIFFVLMWASIAAAAYALSAREREEGYGDSGRGVIRGSLNWAYGVLLFVQFVCIYLTQSRGPWLGLGAGLAAFLVGMWLLGRRYDVVWMRRIGGVATAVMLIGMLFVGALNIPNSPLQSLSNLPGVGRGIERLSTLTRTEDGTGKVRRLIWLGATNLILSDPARAVIGWGPESMYVAYNRFYPPELAQVELRNATPDRSHNVEFDHMVTLGVLGLLAYYFVVGSFFFYAIRIAKRARTTRDQLFSLAMIAAILSHFIEIQTGIQIASTWSYFYLIIGMMVAFGYYMSGYLRPAHEAAVAQVEGLAQEDGSAAADGYDAREAVVVGAETRPMTSAVGTGARAGGATTVAAQASGNGKRPADGTGSRNRTRNGQSSQSQGRTGSGGSGRSGNQPYDKRRASYRTAPVRTVSTVSDQWTRNPAFLAIYAVAALLALYVIFGVNSGTVRADTLFKQAQAYDNAQRYFAQKDNSTGTVYPGSIPFYEEALSLQPNQDYYYLFIGRAWLEAAKHVSQEEYNERNSQPWDTDANKAATQKAEERLYRLQTSEQYLSRAHDLSPINTDHYANLGRLYLAWADPSVGNDASKSPLAVQWMKQATEHTPGNAQLWDELGVAYSRNNQFGEAIRALEQSQFNVDPTFARTPYIRATLLQDRASQVKSALIAGSGLPTDGETDYGKLVLAAGQAFSDTIRLDPTQFIDDAASTQARIAFFIDAAKPFTNTNSSLSPEQLANVLTDTIKLSLTNKMTESEKSIGDVLTQRGVPFTPDANGQVPAATIQQLWTNPSWFQLDSSTGTQVWSDQAMQTLTNWAALSDYALGQIYQSTGASDRAREAYTRALVLQPNYKDASDALKALQ